jgi:hypothetical protein
MLWPDAMCYGAAGGLITEAADLLVRLRAWQQASHAAREKGRKPPVILKFIDPRPDTAVAVVRAVLGCAAGWLLHDQISGMYAAGAVGASAPAVIAALGRVSITPESLHIALNGQPNSVPGPVGAQMADGEQGAAQ